MEFSKQLNQYYVRPERQFRASYHQLNTWNLDIGFTSIIKDGRDFHQITKDIVISVQSFENGCLTNLVLSEGNPIRLELTDREIITYYSDYIELRYILSGHSEVEIEGETIHFTEGEICFINSMSYHRESIANSNCMFINISIKREVFNETMLNNIGLSPLQKFLRMNIMKIGEQQHYLKFSPTSKKDSETIQNCISNIFFEVKNHLPGYIEISKGYIIRLMDDLSSGYQYNFNKQDSKIYNQKLFESITEYMDTNLESITLSDLAEHFHFHENYFNNLIKKMTGVSYSHYLIRLRIEKAKALLASTDLTVDEIMWLVGYNNKGFFYRKFTELAGMSPADYRSSMQHSNL